MGILDDLLQDIPEDKKNITPPAAKEPDKKEPEQKDNKKEWFSDEFKRYANIS